MPRTLAQKLGIKPQQDVYFHQAPPHLAELLPELEQCHLHPTPPESADYIHTFVRTEAELLHALALLKPILLPNSMLWISWPKGSSSLDSEINREDVRHHGLAAGLVDVKVCSVDQDWSGLKFVYRLADR